MTSPQGKSFQEDMPGNICFGCGKDNHDGLQLDSYWLDRASLETVCVWHSQPKYQGWEGLLNGGVLASLVDCHCMGTAIAVAYAKEGRDMHSQPVYRYATGTMNIKYLLPTPNDVPIELRAKAVEVKERKVVLQCDVWAAGKKTAEADVVAVKVYDSRQPESSSFVK